MSAPKKKPTSFSISERADELLGRISEHHGISRSAVIEMLVRAEARTLALE